MAPLVQLIRRHEETALDKDGRKLDRPTPEGLANDYQRGIRLREEYPDHQIYGVASQKERTYIGLVAMLLGAGIPNIQDHIERSSDLNEGKIPPEIRNDKTKRMTALFDECRETTMESGNNLARYLVNQAESYAGSTIPPNKLIIAKTHLPPMMAAYLRLISEPFTLDKAREHMLETKMKPGEGFDVKLEPIGSVYGVTITVGTTERKYELPQLVERIRR